MTVRARESTSSFALSGSMVSDCIDPESANELVDSLARTVIGNLRREKLLGAS